MSPQFPCAVERDLARHDAEMCERDRYEIALEQEAKAVYDGYMASPSPDRLLNAIDRAVSSDVADRSLGSNKTYGFYQQSPSGTAADTTSCCVGSPAWNWH